MFELGIGSKWMTKNHKIKSQIHVEVQTDLFLKSFSLCENMVYRCIGQGFDQIMSRKSTPQEDEELTLFTDASHLVNFSDPSHPVN